MDPKIIKTDDCIFRVMLFAIKRSYLELRIKLNIMKTELVNLIHSDIDFLSDYLKEYPKCMIKHLKGESSFAGLGFTPLHPKGTYVLEMDGHISYCTIGMIFGA